jgi:hypothetical protein
MNLKKLALAVAAGSALLAAVPAFAHPEARHGWRAGHHHHYPHYYYPPSYVYYPPRPVVIYPDPAIYGRIPVGPGVRVGFRIRL